MPRSSMMLLLLLAALALPGCVADKFGAQSRSSGESKVYALEREAALRMCLRVFQSTGADKVAYQRKEDRVFAEYWPDSGSYGTWAAAWVEAEGEGKSRVYVSTQNRYTLQLDAPIDEDTFHERYAKMLVRLRERLAKEAREKAEKTDR